MMVISYILYVQFGLSWVPYKVMGSCTIQHCVSSITVCTTHYTNVNFMKLFEDHLCIIFHSIFQSSVQHDKILDQECMVKIGSKN